MICRNCGTNNVNGGRFCERCGADLAAMGAPAAPSAPAYSAPATPAYGAPAPATNPGKGLGIAALVLGIVSFFCFGVITGVLATVLGAIGYKKSKDVGMKNPMAVAGMICGIIGLGLMILMYIMMGSLIPFAF